MYKGEKEILDVLAKKGKLTFEELAKKTGLHIDTVRRAAESLREKGYLKITAKEFSIVTVTPELALYVKKGFPEFLVFEKARRGKTVNELTPNERRIGLSWAKAKGFIRIDGKRLLVLKTSKDY